MAAFLSQWHYIWKKIDIILKKSNFNTATLGDLSFINKIVQEVSMFSNLEGSFNVMKQNTSWKIQSLFTSLLCKYQMESNLGVDFSVNKK